MGDNYLKERLLKKLDSIAIHYKKLILCQGRNLINLSCARNEYNYILKLDNECNVCQGMNLICLSCFGSKDNYILKVDIERNVELSIGRSNALMKTRQYTPTPVNILADDMCALGYIPFDMENNRAFMPNFKRLEVSTPLNESEDKQNRFIIENDQYVNFLFMNLLLDYKQDEWAYVISTVSKIANKDNSSMQREFEHFQKRVFDINKQKPLTIKELGNCFCKICHLYQCLTHFNEIKSSSSEVQESSELNEIKSSSSEVQESSECENFISDSSCEHRLMTEIDPEHWKSKLFLHEHHLTETGRWAMAYKSRHKSTNTVLNIQLLEFMIEKSMTNPDFLSLILGVPLNNIQFEIPAELSPLDVTFLSSRFFTDRKKYELKMIPTNTEICQCQESCTGEKICKCIYGEVTGQEKVCRAVCDRCCECSVFCRERFLGCDCQYGKCNSEYCVCFKNNRECDPDLCRQCFCLLSLSVNDTENSESINLCQNIKFQRRRNRKNTGLSISTENNAGLGLFALDFIQTGEFVGEYTGELITDRETFIRSLIYDQIQHSYVFGINGDPDWSIDSIDFGSKMRYLNHASHGLDNCIVETWIVNGILKLLVFTTRNICPEEELTFNYRYDIRDIKYNWYLEYEMHMNQRMYHQNDN